MATKRKEPKPQAVDRYEISVSIPLFGKTKLDRFAEQAKKLTAIEDAIAGVGGTCEIAPHTTNEER